MVGAVITGAQTTADRMVQAWLAVMAFLVLCMIAVGGATRLTDSGLSITEWQPLLGAIPPLNEAHWLEAFDKYRQIPEYHLVNKGMSLEEFKFIYWWEWGHRFLGRLIGLAFALPLAFFAWNGMLRPGALPKYLGVLALGGVQGAIGWYMVSSGLVDRVDVSHYRLALHLSVAFLILGLLVWLAMQLRDAPVGSRSQALPAAATAIAGLIVAIVYAQVALGAFVAGLKAGLAYNTWPLMNGRIIPDDLFALSPWLVNFVENATTANLRAPARRNSIGADDARHRDAAARRSNWPGHCTSGRCRDCSDRRGAPLLAGAKRGGRGLTARPIRRRA